MPYQTSSHTATITQTSEGWTLNSPIWSQCVGVTGYQPFIELKKYSYTAPNMTSHLTSTFGLNGIKPCWPCTGLYPTKFDPTHPLLSLPATDFISLKSSLRTKTWEMLTFDQFTNKPWHFYDFGNYMDMASPLIKWIWTLTGPHKLTP